jgi:hypothetical protein
MDDAGRSEHRLVIVRRHDGGAPAILVLKELIDWEDAAVAHPFFTPALLLLSLHYTDALTHVPDAHRRLREAYLYPWTERGPLVHWSPRRLEQVFDLAERVAMPHYAAQFRRTSSLVETSWEVRAFAPLFLRRLLEVGPLT